MKVVVIVVALILASCNGVKKMSMDDENTENAGSDNMLELVMQDEAAVFDTDTLLIIRDGKRLKSFFSKLNRTRKPGLPLPTIDFSKEMLVIQCNAQQDENGIVPLYLIDETDSEITIGLKRKKLGKNKAPVMSNPFCIYKMPLSSKEIVLK